MMIGISNLKNQISNSRRGFTLVELIIVMSIMGILLGLVTVGLSNVRQRTTINTLTQTFVADVRQQQIKAMVGDTQGAATANSYGVHLDTDRYVLFRGAAYSATDPNNFAVDLQDNIQFVNADWDIIFSRIVGDVPTVTDGLVGYWSSNEGTGQIVNDFSGFNNNGTRGDNSTAAPDDPTWTTSKANLGGALDFDGTNDLVRVPGSASLTPSVLSLSLWIKPKVQFNSTSGDIQIAIKSSNFEFIYNVCAVGAFTFSVSNTCSGGAGAQYFSNLEANTWYFFTGTFDGSTARLYLDGNEVASSPDSFIPDTGGFCIGASCIPSRFANAVIDEVRIYNRALTPLEIRYLYNNGSIQLQDTTTGNTKTIQLNRYGVITGVN